MSRHEYIVQIDGEQEYILVDEPGKLTLKRHGAVWSEEVRGEVAMVLEDTGNFVKLTSDLKKSQIDYSQLQELRILLQAYQALNNENAVYKLIPTKDAIKI